jgi:UDP-glucose 4-epimerase
VRHIPKRPGEPDATFADTATAQRLLDWRARVPFEAGVGVMLEHLDDWKDAPVWEAGAIAQATQSWFKYLGDSDDSHA